MLQASSIHATIDDLEMQCHSPAMIGLERHVGGALTLVLSLSMCDISPCRIKLQSKRRISLSHDKLSQQCGVHVHMDSGWVDIMVLSSEEQTAWHAELRPGTSSAHNC